MRLPLVLLAALCLTACSDGAQMERTSAGTAAAAVTGQPISPPTPPTPEAGIAQAVTARNDLYSFDYSYPAQAAAIPALKAWFDADLDKARSGLADEAKAARDDAERQGYPFRPYDLTEHWHVETSLPGWLSLSGEIYTFTGGAHGMSGFETLLWDKAANTRRMPLDLFVSKDALRDAIRKPFCAGLDRERAEKRQGQAIGATISEFVQCIDPTDQTVILGSSSGTAFDRIGILIGPYAAGPYAEGTYDVTVPVTDAVMRAVKPAWRRYFSRGG